MASPHPRRWVLVMSLMSLSAASSWAPCRADSIYLNAEGQKNLDALRLRIAPGTISTDPHRKDRPYIRGMIVGERAARNLKARHDSIEGSQEFDFIAFDATGEQRSGIQTISSAWVHQVVQDFDTDLDVRGLFSDRDQLAGVAPGSRTYFAMARRASDPDGRLGLWQNDTQLPPEPKGVTEGDLIRFIRDPPVAVGGDNAQAWSKRRLAEESEISKRILADRLPFRHRRTDVRPSLLVRDLVDAVAQERAFRLSRTGFDRTAISMLVFILDLSAVRHRDQPSGDDAADAIYFEGLRAVTECFRLVEHASGVAWAHGDPPELTHLYTAYESAKDPAEKRRLTTAYNELQERALRGDRTCVEHGRFCVDSSQRAAAAIDALLASEGMFRIEGYWRGLTDAIVQLHSPREGPDPHKNARIDLRGPSMRLIVRGMNPPPAADPVASQAHERTATAIRSRLFGVLGEEPQWPDQQDAARAIMTAGGWGDATKLHTHTEERFSTALDRAYRAASEKSPEQQKWRHDSCAACMRQLHAIAQLAGSSVDGERMAAEYVLSRIDEMRRAVRDERDDHVSYKYVLAIWDDPATHGR